MMVHRLLSLRHRYPSTVQTKIGPSDDHGGSYPRLLHCTYHECEYNKSINVITSHYSCCINVPHRKKDKMANPF